MSDSDIIIRTRAIPVKPRSKNYPTGTVAASAGGYKGGNTVISSGSAGVDIIKTNDVRSSTDRNVFSSLRTLAEILSIIIPKGDTAIELSDKNVLSALRVAHELDGINKKLEEAINSLKGLYLSKVNDDTAKGCLTLEGGAVANNIESQNFVSGALGEGFVLKRDSKTGKSYFEVDEAYFRMRAIFENLTLKELQHIGGEMLWTLASIECTEVETITEEALCDANGNHLYDSKGRALYVLKPTGGVYRCYFKADDGSKAVQNQFVAGDMAQCKMFNIKEGVYEDVKNKYYWRLVLAVGPNYIDLAMGDCDEGSDVPQAGDKIIQLGNRTDPARQNAILMSAYGENAPLKQMLAGINDYSFADKVVLEEGFNQETHEPFTKNYGMSYTGARDRSSFIEYIPGTGLVVHCVVDGKVVLELNPDKKQYSFAGNITAESGDFGTFKIEGRKGVDENGDYDNRRITFAGPKTDGILASMENIDIPLAFPFPYLSTSGGKRNVGMYLKSEVEDSEDMWMNKTLVTYGNTEIEGLLVQYGGRFKCGLDLETRQFVRKFSASNEIQELIKSRYIMYINLNIHNTYILHCNGYSNCKILLPEYKNFDLTDYVRNGGNLMCEFKFIAHPSNSQAITIQSNPGGTITYENRPTMYNKGTAISSIQLFPGGCVSIAIALFRDNEGDRGESPYYRAIVTNVY